MGADPGPACYGLGGQEPTVTDADLVLGYLDVEAFWGGRMELNIDRASQAIREKVALPLGIDLLNAARGIFEVVNSQMAEAISVASVQKGYDPREFTLVVGGGAGPIHAADIASRLDIPRILIPKSASVLCAMVMLLSDLRHDFSQTCHMSIDRLDVTRVNALYADMTSQALDMLAKEGVLRARMQMQRWMDLRYIGQFHEVRIPLPAEEAVASPILATAVAAFHQRHEELFGYAMPGAPVELVNLRMTAIGQIDKPALAEQPDGGPDPSSALKHHRSAFLDGSFREVPIYDGSRLRNGNVILGPAIVEEPSTTVVVPSRYRLHCDPLGNYLLSAEVAEQSARRDGT
jgi:N-methylhydantoinase A